MFSKIIHWYKMKTSPSYRFAFFTREAMIKACSQEPDSPSQRLTHETRAFPQYNHFEALPGNPDRHDLLNFERGYRYGVDTLITTGSVHQSRAHFAMARGGYFFDGFKRGLAQRSGAGS